MKNFTLLLASAALVSSAWAAEPLAVRQQAFPGNFTALSGKAELLPTMGRIPAANLMSKAPRFRAGESAGEAPTTAPEAKYITPAYGVLYTGLSPELGGYKNTVGVAGVKGAIDFIDLTSGGADSFKWTYQDALTETDYDFTGQDFSLKADVNKIFTTPTLTATNSLGTSQYTFEDNLFYYFGGSLSRVGQDQVGLTTYPFCGENDYKFSTTIYFSYDKTGESTDYYDENGTCVYWPELLAETETDVVTDVKVKSFAAMVPEQSSPYMISTLYGWFHIQAETDTELTARLYAITSEGISSTPFAIGHATVTAGETSGCPVFEILPIDEDGDEIDGDVVVTTALLIDFDVEGVEGLTAFSPVCGMGSELPKELRQHVSAFYPACAYINLGYNLNGSSMENYFNFPGFYDGTTPGYAWYPAYFTVMMDATFTYVMDAEGNVKDTFTVEAPAAGGEVTVGVQPLYYQLSLLVEEGYMTADTEADWFTYELSDATQENYLTTITIDANALPEGEEGRQGVIEFKGMGQDFKVVVNQGVVASIDNITAGAAEGAKQYFDLQGRRLSAAPAAGLYIERQGNTVTKILK